MQTKKSKNNPGAGFVIVRYFNGQSRILGLMDDDAFDLPKGSMDPGENILQTALRETEEESSITQLQFSWGLKYIALNNLTIFIATTKEDPVIKPNPETGKLEHKYAAWLQFDKHYFKPRLQPAIEWAKSIVDGGSFVNF